MSLPLPAPPLLAQEGPPPFAPRVLHAFGEVVRLRFGLARMCRSTAGLARRLSLALAHAGVPAWDAERFVRALSRPGADASAWLRATADALTNRETWFFRDYAQLESALEEAGRAAQARGDGALRVLSAGCSTGEEALSVAMLALDAPHLFHGPRLEVAGFDVSPQAVARAQGGVYRVVDLRRAERGPEGWEGRFFRREGETLLARRWLAERVRFAVHNLLSAAGAFPEGGHDVVLCRNVLIYFDEASVALALAALATWVRPGGLLVLGASEAGLAREGTLPGGDARLVPHARLPGAFRKRGDA